MSKRKNTADDKSAQKIKYRQATLAVSLLETNSGQIEGLPRNPRLIKGDKFKALRKSVGEDPEMMEIRPVVVVPHGEKYVILGGNMRTEAARANGQETVPCIVIDEDTPLEWMREFVLKDNGDFGEWDWDMLTNEVIADDVDTWLIYHEDNLVEFVLKNGSVKVSVLPYKVGEVVAVAQKYIDLCNCSAFYEALTKADPTFPLECIKGEKGCNNKMFAKADWMPHQIRITDIKVERLQDISEEDCLKEGIMIDGNRLAVDDNIYVFDVYGKHKNRLYFPTPKEAFAALIDGVSGKGTWEKNPWVFCYSFELVK